MHTFINLCQKNKYEDTETVLIEVPASMMEEVLPYIRSVQEQQNITENAAINKLLRKAYDQVTEEYYERKNRKTKKR